MAERCVFTAVVVVILASISNVWGLNNGRALAPPYFNLAVGSEIYSTSTCGEDVSEQELFCKLTGTTPGRTEAGGFGEYEVIQGQLCDFCDPLQRDKSHPARQAIDGTERWWQSPPLSRGLQFREVNLTIDLGQEFHVAYVFMKMGNSPRPGVFALERSTDYGETWLPWQFFADTPSNCHKFFGDFGYSDHIQSDNSVVCTTEYSKVVPLEGGEIVISLVNDRPSSENFTYARELQEFTTATNVRLRLLETKTLQGHLMAVSQEDPSVTRRYFYSIKDISIGGRCVCNGHANVCDKADPFNPHKLICSCQHNTCGAQCEMCCPGFVQKPWQPAILEDAHECEPCQCYGHTDQCVYDEEVAASRESIDIHGNFEGGGVCQNCRHNTEGINCEMCAFGFYRPTGVALDSPYVCQQCRCDPTFSTGDCEDGNGRCLCRPEYAGINCERCNRGYYGYPYCQVCDCNYNGTLNEVCQVGGGQCPCKPSYDGLNCDQCAYGYYGFPDCMPCGCNGIGALGGDCEKQSGQCTCNPNYGGRDCGECADGYYSYPSCQLCNCDQTGTTESVCDHDTGRCVCQDNFGGARCDQCSPGFYKYPYCIECGCNDSGSQLDECDATGQCICKYNYAGKTCDRCSSGHYKYPECLSCHCDIYGSYSSSCHQNTGVCDCKPTFEGLTCDKCKPDFFNYPQCEECNCNPAGAVEVPGYPLGGCGSAQVIGTLCQCKERVRGNYCDQCKPGHWDLNINNPLGCEDCRCYRPGTPGGTNACDTTTGQCVCKTYAAGQRCDTCAPGTYNLQEYHYFGCQDCECDLGGSLNHICDVDSGQCQCRPRISGRRCDSPLANHHFPTLHHHKYELEDGRTERGGLVRYGFDNNIFDDYSWRGYAIFSRLQSTVIVDADIEQPSLYRLIYRYVNPTGHSVTADVVLTPESSGNVQQTSTVVLEATIGNKPELVTVSGAGEIATFVLNPGRWSIALKTEEPIYGDYLVLIPQAYYEATVLQKPVNRPCTVPSDNGLCKHFTYPDLDTFPTVRGEDGVVIRGGQRQDTQLFPNREINEELGTNNMAHLNPSQTTLVLNLPVPRPGRYVFLVKYYSPELGRSQEVAVEVASSGGRDKGRLILPGCPYSSLCREVVVDDRGNVKVFDTGDGSYATITLRADDDVDLAIDEVIAIPYDQWVIGYVQPKLKCIRRDGVCTDSDYVTPTGTTRVEFESGSNEDRVATDVPPYIRDVVIKVIKLDGAQPTVSVRVSAQNTGEHALVIHYYQPHHVGFDVNVKVRVDGRVVRGKFHAGYCPHVSGCRAPIIFEDGSNTTNLSNRDVELEFNSTSPHPVWVDYIMLIPAINFKDDVLDVLPVDKSVEFIEYCGKDNFYIDSTTTGFCRESVFTLTTDHNNGGISCDCDPAGSQSFSCDQFAGQCPCKRNVIGRRCTQCRTGYYGFPNCRRCDCPSGLCEPDSGRCVCPPQVTGPNCDTCLPRTFGFDPFIGCEDCNCDEEGVRGRNLDCDIGNGQCSCKSNIGGRRCDRCEAGFYRYPRCLECSCETRGTTEDICDQRTSNCICKENVEGPMCSQCKRGTFYLEDRNRKGCAQCFCFGTTTHCDSDTTSFRRSQVMDMENWRLTNLQRANIENRGRGELQVKVDFYDWINPDEDIYWIAPEPYLGNKVTSYGGRLIYTIRFSVPYGSNSAGTINSDVRIEGSGMTIEYVAEKQPVANTDLTIELDLLETSFRHISSDAEVNREQFLMILARITSLHIRASYYTEVNEIFLSDVYMDIASRDGTGSLARNVEQCQCPSNYRGTSCEECASGFYRSKDGPYLGACVPCQCNGKTDTCDPDTGNCIGCRDGFGGPQCLKCAQGYYEDPYTGTCEICACPTDRPENNFAKTCTVYHGVVASCECLDGYAGSKCDLCEVGYWGNPTQRGGKCQPCDCSGNINIDDPTSCDVLTGACLKCLNNAEGPRCERCKQWYWGDAIDLKDCRACTCDRVGTERCDSSSGRCRCKPNVVGDNCDQCAPGTFGFDSGRGCEECDCGRASLSEECDVYSGQCQCMRGVTGRRCDQCAPGFWDYGPTGCTDCQCTSDGATTCDPYTGYCQCLPGVTGPKCDQCLTGWLLIPGQGCQQCDRCVSLLLEDVANLDNDLSTASEDLIGVSGGVLTLLRVERMNETVNELRKRVPTGCSRSGPTDGAVGSDVLAPHKAKLLSLQDKANEVSTKADRALREAKVNEADSDDIRTDADNLNGLIRMGKEVAGDLIAYIEDAIRDIRTQVNYRDIDLMVREAEDMLREIRRQDVSAREDTVRDEEYNALDNKRRVQIIADRADDQMKRAREVMMELDEVEEKLKELTNSSQQFVDKAVAANTQNRRQLSCITDLTQQIRDLARESQMMIDMSRQMLEDAEQYVDDAERAYDKVESDLSKLDWAKESVQEYAEDLAAQNEDLRPLVDAAMRHALGLRDRADELENLFGKARDSSPYKVIVDAINDADNASVVAENIAMAGLDESYDLMDRARESRLRSEFLEEQADNTNDKVNDELKPMLGESNQKIDDIRYFNSRSREGLNEVVAGLEMLPDEFSTPSQETMDKAMDANQKAKDAGDRITEIYDRLVKGATLQEKITEANRDIRNAQGQVEDAVDLVPRLADLMDRLESKASSMDKLGVDMGLNVDELKEKILLARGAASTIKVGMQFNQDTTLQVRNPSNIGTAGFASRISLFFRTTEPYAFLAYVGPSAGQRSDYMAVEIVNGYATMKFDLGAGQTIVVNEAIKVNDGEWHEVIAERNVKTGTLTVLTEDEPDEVATGEAYGTFFVLDLDPSATEFYVGGVPPHGRSFLRGKLDSFSFEGCLEDVKFGDVPVGLWDFVYGQNNGDGCQARDKLVGITTSSFKFAGDSYMILDGERVRPASKMVVSMNFKTFAENGLLFLAGNGTDYYAIELQDGKVLFQYDLGSGPPFVISREKYNDGQWHELVANRLRRDCIIKVDGKVVGSGRSPGIQKELTIGKKIYLGGEQGEHKYLEVTHQPFEGCIEKVMIGSSDINLNDNLGAKGVVPGCSEVSRTVSFNKEDMDSYISIQSVDVDEDFTLSMKIKTVQDDGLLFYVTDDEDQNNALSVALKEGKIVVVATASGRRTTLQSNQDFYNDGRWHYISVTKKDLNLQLDIDDSEMTSEELGGRGQMVTTSPVYFGGILPGSTTVSENYATDTRFLGCIGDVSVNGAAINFAEADRSKQMGASLSACRVPDPEPPSTAPPGVIVLTPPTGIDQPAGDATCALPRVPVSSSLVSALRGPETEFCMEGDGYLEYASVPGDIRTGYEFSMDIKTSDDDGLLFYVSDDAHGDFVALYMEDGYIKYAFDLGTGRMEVTSQKPFNDGQWHSVTFWREQKRGRLIVDGSRHGQARAGGTSKSIDETPPFYVGGLTDQEIDLADRNLEGITMSYRGTLRNLRLNSFDFEEPSRRVGSTSCTSAAGAAAAPLEAGVFIHEEGGYLIVDESFDVGFGKDIYLEIKPRTVSGVILSVATGAEYLTIQLVDGTLILSADAGAGEMRATHIPALKNDLCDGTWHTIEATIAKNVVSFSVDGVYALPGIGPVGVSTTDTRDPLYLGGSPESHPGLLTREQYVGCIRNLEIDGAAVNLRSLRTTGTVTLNGCFTD